jgi:LacI family transcriptional regulator
MAIRVTVTQKDIAKRLGVSTMTVSKALAGHPDVSPKTRERVLEVAREMHYRVNRVARSLVRRSTRTIGVIVPDVSEFFYTEILNGIESATRAENYNLLLANSDNDPDIEVHSLQTLLENRIDGLLFCPSEKNNAYTSVLKTTSVPFVVFNNTPEGLDCDTIRVDRGHGAYLSVSHLLDRGYGEILFFYTFAHMSESRNSLEGCRRAARERGIPPERMRLVECPTRNLEEFHDRALTEIRFSGTRIGVFVWDDEMAAGVYRAVTELSLSIPDQVGLAGFDDIRIARYFPKALTTVHYPKYEMGRLGAEMLIRRIVSRSLARGGAAAGPGAGTPAASADREGVTERSEHVVLGLELVHRETT